MDFDHFKVESQLQQGCNNHGTPACRERIWDGYGQLALHNHNNLVFLQTLSQEQCSGCVSYFAILSEANVFTAWICWLFLSVQDEFLVNGYFAMPCDSFTGRTSNFQCDSFLTHCFCVCTSLSGALWTQFLLLWVTCLSRIPLLLSRCCGTAPLVKYLVNKAALLPWHAFRYYPSVSGNPVNEVQKASQQPCFKHYFIWR